MALKLDNVLVCLAVYILYISKKNIMQICKYILILIALILNNYSYSLNGMPHFGKSNFCKSIHDLEHPVLLKTIEAQLPRHEIMHEIGFIFVFVESNINKTCGIMN